ncbi:NAD-dependent epimerase/dehydratase family protein [Actinomycetospora aeridis]|uniref:NAD-dependent epimerase/dehydratase family protein n=1 Tax=Actinomycetospora aeridis TaxID=3129231 RepID=A0ABU8N967_9PSEU
MRLLVLGGGGFLGYHVAAEALRDGHDVTVASRSGRAPLDGVEALTVDRHGDLSALDGRRFDAALDTFSDPDAVRSAAERLRGAVGGLGYVSGMSVYHPDGPAVPDEGAPVRRPGEAAVDDPLQERSLAKLAAEEAVTTAFDGPVTVLRVGVMVGPRDPSDRFTWWPVRLARALAGEAPQTVLAPGDPTRAVQYSDARDIAAFAVRALGSEQARVFDTVGPGRAQPLAAVLEECLAAAGGRPGDVTWAWAGENALRSELRDVEEEARPLWFPEDQIPQDAIDSSAAIAAGLRFRPAADTARDVLAWFRERGDDELAAGFDPTREADLVARCAEGTAPTG